jgi:hypothetical protein
LHQRVPTLKDVLPRRRTEACRSQRTAGPVSPAQWIVYFLAEMSLLAPGLPDRKLVEMASLLRASSPGITPEHAAACMAVGLTGASFH